MIRDDGKERVIQEYVPGKQVTLAHLIAKPVIGIVTKTDLAKSEQEIEQSEQSFRSAGAKQIFRVLSFNENGIEELADYLSAG